MWSQKISSKSNLDAIALGSARTARDDLIPQSIGEDQHDTCTAPQRGASVIRNRLQSLIHRHNLILPKGMLRDKGWWESQEVSALEKIQIRQELAMLDEMEKHKREVDAELGRQSLGEVWGKQAMRLLQLSGFGVIVTTPALLRSAVQV